MGRRVLEGIDLSAESRPYIDCLYTVLTAARKFCGPKYLLSGMTGFSFIFVAHRDLITASTEMYNLRDTGKNALDILGYYCESYDGLKTSPTFPLYQKRAIKRIKESLDEGMAVIIWAAGVTDFGVVFGYDDEDEVFFYKDRHLREEQILLYENLGRVEANYWLCQIIGERVEKDIRDIYMDSLEFAVDCWETPYVNANVLKGGMASGKKAYEYLLKALLAENRNDLGAGKIIYYNIISKEETYRYLHIVKEEIPEVYPAYLKYRELHGIYQDIKKILPIYRGPAYDYGFERTHELPKLIEYCTKAYEVEAEAVDQLKHVLYETLNNRYIDIFDVKKFR